MKLSELNNWLTLVTNIGVLVGIGFLVLELQQTQTAMLADSSTTRAQMVIDRIGLSRGYGEIRQKAD